MTKTTMSSMSKRGQLSTLYRECLEKISKVGYTPVLAHLTKILNDAAAVVFVAGADLGDPISDPAVKDAIDTIQDCHLVLTNHMTHEAVQTVMARSRNLPLKALLSDGQGAKEPKEQHVFKVTIEETRSYDFYVQHAGSMDEAISVAQERYRKGAFVLLPEMLAHTQVMAEDLTTGDCTEWCEMPE